MKLYFTAVPFVGFNIVISTYFTSTEKALPAQAVSLSRGFVLIIPMAYVMARLQGMTGVWLSYPFTEGAVTLMGVILGAKMGESVFKPGFKPGLRETAPLHETNFPDTIKK